MAFPRKFKSLLETTLKDVEVPDAAWLVYSVCGCEQDSCGWAGWTIEWVFKANASQEQAQSEGITLAADDGQICPRCGKDLFRTEVAVRLDRSSDQVSPHGNPGKEYEIAEIEYED